MKNRLNVFRVLLVSIGLLAPAVPLGAHHSLSAEFDTTRTLTLVGTITEMRWTNPHAWLYIDVKDDAGKVQKWAIEFGSPNQLYRRGWRREDLPAKASVTVTGYPARDKSRTVSSTDVKLPDGRTLFGGTPQPGGPQ